MLKVKKVKLSGFRGMLKLHELDFTKDGEVPPSSFALYGLNSSGKTSFVDGIEWFLSETNQIEWLAREDAKEKAYPHQEAKNNESFVEVEFEDSDKKINTLRKSFNFKKITQPELSSEEDFETVYKSFVIRPYLRYLEVIDFVYNRSSAEKYQKLANWMGFESELAFQEKIALQIMPELRRKEKTLTDNIKFLDKNLCILIEHNILNEDNLISFCNNILNENKISSAKSINDLWKSVETLSKTKVTSTTSITVSKLTENEVALFPIIFDDVFIFAVKSLQEALTELSKEKKLLENIDRISLYTQAFDIINKTVDPNTNCPVCGSELEKETLLSHIKVEMELLQSAKERKDELIKSISSLKILIRREQELCKNVILKYEDIKKLITSLTYEKITKYQLELSELELSLSGNPFTDGVKFASTPEDINEINLEKGNVVKDLKAECLKIQPTKEELKLISDIEKLKLIKQKWNEIEGFKEEYNFFSQELENFVKIGNSLVQLIQDNVKGRFEEMSGLIGKYFSILRRDKDIKCIEIILNEEKGKAAGRSAEIQMSYFDIAVKPAYKVLSESLLNSLGLAVYFTCVKQFNTKCKFVVLDDIMNSLDIDNRDTVLDLIEQEFSDYQVVLFTHDYYWYQRIVRRFPHWVCKKIKSWGYKDGARIDFIKTTKTEIEELLSDSTTIEDAGFKLGKHVEGILNELCEKLEAEVKYRYLRSDPPSMEELIDALYKRLKNKLNKNQIVEKVLNLKKYEPNLRNFTGHPRTNYPTTISSTEVRRAMEEWFDLENDLWCLDCKHYVSFIPKKDSIECNCGKIKLLKQVNSNSSYNSLINTNI